MVDNFKSEHTAKNYVKYLKEAYMLVGIQKYSQKSKQRSVQEKVYAVDVAMMDQRENLSLLTDHESDEIEEDGHKMKVQPVYEWSLELGV